MIIRNGIRSTLRARGRTALFTALILVLTLSLSLGLGMWAYCGRTLTEMDQRYTSVALLEYLGGDYPDGDAADEYARHRRGGGSVYPRQGRRRNGNRRGSVHIHGPCARAG